MSGRDNGTSIADGYADQIAEIGFDYVGISLDGIGATNDWFLAHSHIEGGGSG